ncbi:MAG: hypothetical protein RH982_10420 [Parvibaculum sp.]
MRMSLWMTGMVFAAVAAAASPALAGATLEGGTVTIGEGETASFPILGAGDGPADLNAQCSITDVSGTASITFDGEHYVPLSDPAIGEVITLSGGERRDYQLIGVADAQGGEAYVAFHFTGAPAPMCFPGMNCSGAEGASGSVTVTCANAAP